MFWSRSRWFLLFFVILDLVFLNYKVIKLLNLPSPTTPPPQIIIITPSPTSIPTITLTLTPTITVTLQTKKTKTVAYLPIPGNGQSANNLWENLSGTEFNLDTSDYPNLKDAYFEANMKLLNGNGAAYLRLFDVTAGIEVWGSEIKSQGQISSMIVSSKLTLRSGNHQYRIQAKSLTADTTVFTSGRIKLISEN
jgi:hypothetical protein